MFAGGEANADFRQGLSDYKSGNYEAARAQFLALASSVMERPNSTLLQWHCRDKEVRKIREPE
jgi:hypothetical protein